jgi:hypothetical protein
MDGAPPAPWEPDLIAVTVRRHLDPAWCAFTPPTPFPPEPSGILQALDGGGDRPATASHMGRKCLVGGEAGPGFLVGEPEGKLPPDQLVYCREFSVGNPVSPQCVENCRNLFW